MQTLNRNGILVPPEQLATNAQAQEYVVVHWNGLLNTDTPQMCLNASDQEPFRGRRVIVAGYYGNDYLSGKRQISALQRFDDYGMITSFVNVNVKFQDILFNLQKQLTVRRLTELSNSIILYALAAGEILNATNSTNWPSAMRNGTLLHTRMARRSFQGVETELKIDENGERIHEFILTVIDPNNTVLLLKNIRYNVTCWSCKKVEMSTIVEEMNLGYWRQLGGQLPKDEPDCGFTGKKCAFNTDIVIIMAAIAFALILIGVVYVIRKGYQNSRLKSMIWLLESEKITLHKVATLSFFKLNV